jgi:hypothetical protein
MCFDSKTNPMMKVTTSGVLTSYQSRNEKISALKERDKNDKFFIAWGGQWKTDVFEVSEEDIAEVLQE